MATVADISPSVMQVWLTNFLDNCLQSKNLVLPTRGKETTVWHADSRRYVYNGQKRQVTSDDNKLIFYIMVEQILKNLIAGKSVNLGYLNYSVNCVFKGKFNKSWGEKKGKIPDDIIRSLVEDVCCQFRCTKKSLGVIDGNTKCIVGGNVQIIQRSSIETMPADQTSGRESSKDEPYTLDCLGSFQSLKVEVNLCRGFDCPSDPQLKPRFILVIEKETILDELLRNKFPIRCPCILVTGRGMPGFDTRVFLNKLCDHFKDLPVFGLVDFNLGGLAIFRAYKYGTYSSAYASFSLTVERLQFLGLSYSDIKSHGVLVDMNENDCNCAQRLNNEEWVVHEPEISHNIVCHLSYLKKGDIESLDESSGAYFLSQEWLPAKIRNFNISVPRFDEDDPDISEGKAVKKARIQLELEGSSARHDHGPLRIDGAGSTFDVKATYDGEIVRIDNFSIRSSIEKLKEEVGKKLELDVGKIKMKYLDTSNEWIRLTAVSDLVHAQRIYETSGKGFFRLKINLKS